MSESIIKKQVLIKDFLEEEYQYLLDLPEKEYPAFKEEVEKSNKYGKSLLIKQKDTYQKALTLHNYKLLSIGIDLKYFLLTEKFCVRVIVFIWKRIVRFLGHPF